MTADTDAKSGPPSRRGGPFAPDPKTKEEAPAKQLVDNKLPSPAALEEKQVKSAIKKPLAESKSNPKPSSATGPAESGDIVEVAIDGVPVEEAKSGSASGAAGGATKAAQPPPSSCIDELGVEYVPGDGYSSS